MKFFVASDIHSYYSIFKQSLDESGYDENNPEHYLIICGDCFDRGDESQEVLIFLNNRERCILIRGNHEDLILDCIDRGYFQRHDIHNGTVKTIMTLGNKLNYFDGKYPTDEDAYKSAANVTWAKVKPFIDKMVDYFETEKYIFVHSWIPYDVTINKTTSVIEEILSSKQVYQEDWRKGDSLEWDNARWENPFVMANKGLNQTGKTIVFGHWHTSAYHAKKNNTTEFGDNACFDIAYDTDHKVIGIDACTAHTGKCNILVLEDNFINE